MTWQDYLTGFALPPAGALKLDAKLNPLDPDCAMFAPFEVATRRMNQLSDAISKAGLTGAYAMVDGIASGDLEDFSLTPAAVAGDPNSVGAWFLNTILTAAADMTIPSGSIVLSVPKGSRVRLTASPCMLNARATVTIKPGEQVALRTPLDRNWQVIGWGPTASQQTVDTSIALDWSAASTVGATDVDFYVQPYFVAP